MFSNLFEQNNLMCAYRYVNWDALKCKKVFGNSFQLPNIFFNNLISKEEGL